MHISLSLPLCKLIIVLLSWINFIYNKITFYKLHLFYFRLHLCKG